LTHANKHIFCSYPILSFLYLMSYSSWMRQKKNSCLWLTLYEIALVPLNADNKEKENNNLVTEQDNKIINNFDKVNDCLDIFSFFLFSHFFDDFGQKLLKFNLWGTMWTTYHPSWKFSALWPASISSWLFPYGSYQMIEKLSLAILYICCIVTKLINVQAF